MSNKPFAIILDGKVLSAPNINEPILGGSAQISGSFTPEERQRAGDRAALGQAAGQAQGGGGAHRRAGSRRRFDP
jgi:preprotein translocase subunit SecD